MAGSSPSPAPIILGSSLSQKRKASAVGPSTRQRTPQACLPCRKKKSKCDGDQPSCRNCRRLNRKCAWSDPVINLHVDVDLYSLSEIQDRLLLDTFFSIPHLETVRLSIHKPSFNSIEFRQHPEFLRLSICTLAALYLDHEATTRHFDGDTPLQISEKLVLRARQMARNTSDQPTVKNIQANLILALRELVARAGYNSYIYSGFAIRMAHTLRLMKEYHQRHPPLEREIRRRCMWSCIVIDILVSMTFSRPTAVQTQWTYIQLPCPEVSFMFGEDYPSLTLAQFVERQPDNPDLFSYFIKATDMLNTITEHVRAWVVQDKSSNIDGDLSNPFETKLGTWISKLPSRMTWSRENLQVFRLLGQGNLFVTFHMVLAHSLSLVPQLFLPYNGTNMANSSITLSERQLAAIRKCLHHADQITTIASILHKGDDVDREILRSPFTSLAMMTAASIHIWSAHSEVYVEAAAVTPMISTQPIDSTPHHHLQLFVQVFQSWAPSWPLARGCLETINFLEQLYNVAYSVMAAPLEDGRISKAKVDLDRTAAVGSGIYEPPGGPFMLSRWTQVLLAVQSESQAVKTEHAHAQLRILCQHMLLKSRMASVSSQEIDLDNGDADIYIDGYENSYEALEYLDIAEFQTLGGFAGLIDTSSDVYDQTAANYIPSLQL